MLISVNKTPNCYEASTLSGLPPWFWRWCCSKLLSVSLINNSAFSQKIFQIFTIFLKYPLSTPISFPSWKRKWHPTPVILPEKFHGQRNLADYIPRGCKESGMTGQLSIPFLPTYDSDSEKMDKNILTSSSIPTNFPVPYPIIPSSPFRKKTVSLFKANPSNLYF